MKSRSSANRVAFKREGRPAWSKEAGLRSVSVLVLAVAAMARPSVADEWTGAFSDVWHSAANWDTNTVPTGSTSVFINTEGAGWSVINGANAYSEVVSISVS